MKSTKPLLLFIILSHFVFSLSAQDIIKTKTGDVYKCDITKITPDTIYFLLSFNDQITSTHIDRTSLSDFSIGIIEKLKEDYDSTMYYTMTMDDGSTLKGKIETFNKTSILISDNNLGAITVQAEHIKSLTKSNPDAYLKIVLNDGNILNGKIIERKPNIIVLKTSNLGVLNIPTNSIKSITEIEQENIKNGKYWFPNPNSSRYFFGPSGISLKKGEGYYQNIYVAYNSVSYGVTDYFTIGGGVVLPVAAFVTPKISFQIAPNFYMGAGVLFGIAPDNTIIGVTYGITTYGTIEHNITLGVGFGFYDEEFQNKPIITLSGMTRISRRIALVTENWVVPYTDYTYINGVEKSKTEYYPVITYGIRLMSEKRFSFDFAFVNSKDIVDMFFIGIPYIDFVLKF